MNGRFSRSACFEFGEREAGIGGEKGARGVDGFEHHFAAAAAAHAEAENPQQFAGFGRFAGFDLDDLARAGQFLQFARLREIAMHQLQILGLLQRIVAVGRLVAVGDHVARHRRHARLRAGHPAQMAAMRLKDRIGPGISMVFASARRSWARAMPPLFHSVPPAA